MGRLTRDPEVRYTGSGTAVASFTLAVDRAGDRGEDGSYQPGFFDCEAWDKTAELIEQYIGKGRQVGVEGRLKLHKWETQEGGKRSRVEVVVSRVTFGERPAEDRDGQQQMGERPPEFTPAAVDTDFQGADDDIPF